MTDTKLTRSWVVGEYEVTDRKSGRRLGLVRRSGASMSGATTQWIASTPEHTTIPGPSWPNRWDSRADAVQAVVDADLHGVAGSATVSP